jgi:hypothetical protein
MARGAPRDLDERLERRGHLSPAQADVGKQPQALARALVEDGEHAEPPPVDQPLVHEVHGPALVRRVGHPLRDPLPLRGTLPRGGPYDQSFLRVEPVDPLRVDQPAFPAEEHCYRMVKGEEEKFRALWAEKR